MALFYTPLYLYVLNIYTRNFRQEVKPQGNEQKKEKEEKMQYSMIQACLV